MDGGGRSGGRRGGERAQPRLLFLVRGRHKRDVVVIALLWIVAVSLIDLNTGPAIALTPLLSVAPIIAAAALDPLETAGFAALALLTTVLLGEADHDLTTDHHAIGTSVVLVIGLLAVWISYLRVWLSESLDNADELATHDALTGALNTRALLSKGAELALLRPNYRPSVAFMMIDVDRFKNINDTYGHLVGDEVLAGVSRRLSGAFRSGDCFGRYGGDEFLALLVGSDRREAKAVAERTLSLMRDTLIATSAGDISVSVSIGMSVLAPDELEVDRALHRADSALYQSKWNGRARSTWVGLPS